MEEDRPYREVLHELGNAQQEKVALQYLLLQAADHIEALAELVPGKKTKRKAVEAAERFRRSAEL